MAHQAGDTGEVGLIPGLWRSPGGGHGIPLQYSCLENPHGQRSLVGYSPRGRREADTTEATARTHTHATLINSAVIISVNNKGTQPHIYMYPFSSKVHSPPLQAATSHWAESPCYTVGPSWLSILYIAVCTCPSQTPYLRTLPTPPPSNH